MVKLKDLIQNKTYWTYYVSRSSKRPRIKDNYGLCAVIPTKKRENTFFYNNENHTTVYWEFIVIEGRYSRYPDLIKTHLNNYNCEFYETEEEAITAHDNQIKSFAEELPTKQRDNFYQKLIVKDKPKQSELEINAINWYNSLFTNEKEYVKWIKHYYSKI